MKQSHRAVAALAVTLGAIAGAPLEGQEGPLPLTPLAPSGDQNPDGSKTFSFGYFNRNTQEVIDIPVGPNNFVEPAEFNGLQPTHFRPVNYGGFSGRRERGVFAVTVPADFQGDVVWTITHAGKTTSVPGRSTAGAYELSHSPQAAGSLPPLVKVDRNAEPRFGRGPEASTILSAKVGEPVTLWVWGEDRGERDQRYQVNATWVKHQGPGEVTFQPATLRSPEAPGGELTTTATFGAPGEYVVRVRIDNFTTSDSSFADQCCWSNGYYRVNVTQ
jgi:hypothetical protein